MPYHQVPGCRITSPRPLQPTLFFSSCTIPRKRVSRPIETFSHSALPPSYPSWKTSTPTKTFPLNAWIPPSFAPYSTLSTAMSSRRSWSGTTAGPYAGNSPTSAPWGWKARGFATWWPGARESWRIPRASSPPTRPFSARSAASPAISSDNTSYSCKEENINTPAQREYLQAKNLDPNLGSSADRDTNKRHLKKFLKRKRREEYNDHIMIASPKKLSHVTSASLQSVNTDLNSNTDKELDRNDESSTRNTDKVKIATNVIASIRMLYPALTSFPVANMKNYAAQFLMQQV